MSGGAVAVVPAMLLAPAAVAAAAVVASAGLAAALVVRAAQAGTEATGRALEHFADEMECHAKAQDDREIQARLWGLAAGAVVQANQELRLLAGRAEKAGIRVPLPGPFDLTGHGLADIRGWVVQAEQALAAARAEVERAEADRERRSLLARLPAPAGGPSTAADLLADFAKTLASRPRRIPGQQPPAPVPEAGSQLTDQPRAAMPRVDQGRVRAEIGGILARLDTDATAAEREEAILAAGRAAKQRDIDASRTYLDALARKVDEVINPKAAGRREAAGWLAALEHPVVVEAIAEIVPPLPPHLGSIDRLRAVVRGDADLTTEDRHAALEALAWAQKQVECRRLLEAMAETFAGLGYSVSTGMDVYHTAGLRVARDAWRDAHSADVWIDEAGRVQWRLVELAPDAGAEASRCEDLNQSMRVVGDALARRGYDADVQVPAALVKPVRRHGGRPDAADSHDRDAGLRARRRYHDDEETS